MRLASGEKPRISSKRTPPAESAAPARLSRVKDSRTPSAIVKSPRWVGVARNSKILERMKNMTARDLGVTA